VQDGSKLVGTGYVGYPYQGCSVSIDGAGKTFVAGAYGDAYGGVSGGGAAWVFHNDLGTWQQQGVKLVGAGSSANDGYQGYSVAISGDGNTIIMGGMRDDAFKGSSWIFFKKSNLWLQQGPKLQGVGATNLTYGERQGTSVALSYDGNTAVVGGCDDNTGTGAVWIFRRTDSTWTQEGTKLTASDGAGMSQFGSAVDISGDGKTIVVGGPWDNTHIGAIWVFKQSGGVWTQQGSKLVPNDGSGLSELGTSVAISFDGTTVAAGGTRDNGYFGAVWAFTLDGGTWSQQGPKMVGTGAVNSPHFALQGSSVDLTANGDTLVISGEDDNDITGALWTFQRSGGSWTQMGQKFVGTGIGGSISRQGCSVSISAHGTVIAEGGRMDDNDIGATWIFKLDSSSSIKEADLPSHLLYPNPTDGVLYIRSDAGFGTIQGIEIFNSCGQLLADPSPGDVIDLRSFNPGLYFVVLTNTGGEKIVEKVLRR
jgi:hypothetical protein